MVSSLALLLLSIATPQAGITTKRVTAPLHPVHLDLATGTVTHGPHVQSRAGTTVVDFSALSPSGFVGVDTGGGSCEWIVSGIKGFSGNTSDLMSEIVFSYCSSALDPNSGGPGASVRLGFYEGYTGGGGSPTTTVAVLNLSGLPGNTTSSSFFGGFRCYFLQVQFANLVSFSDGQIGYSWRFVDQGTTGVLAATFPFLACVQSCSGTGPGAQGAIGGIDPYCPPGTLAPCSFSSCPPFRRDLTIAMEIREVTDTAATVAPFPGDGINADALSAAAIRVAQPWSVTLAIGHAHGAGGALSLRVRTQTTNGANVTSPIGGRLTEVLIAGPLLATVTGSHDGATGSFPTIAVPASIDLVCQDWAAQATVLGGGFADLSTAAAGVVGTE